MTPSAARAISNQLQANWYLQETNRHLGEVNTVLGAAVDRLGDTREIVREKANYVLTR